MPGRVVELGHELTAGGAGGGEVFIAFFDAADDLVEKAACSRRKGQLAAFRDATLFKVIYGWGLFSRGHRLWRKPGLRVCAAQRLME